MPEEFQGLRGDVVARVQRVAPVPPIAGRVHTRVPKRLAKVRVATTVATAWTVPNNAERTGAAVRPRPGSSARRIEREADPDHTSHRQPGRFGTAGDGRATSRHRPGQGQAMGAPR